MEVTVEFGQYVDVFPLISRKESDFIKMKIYTTVIE